MNLYLFDTVRSNKTTLSDQAFQVQCPTCNVFPLQCQDQMHAQCNDTTFFRGLDLDQ